MGRRKNVIAPNDEKALVAMEKMSTSIEKARELYGDGEPFDEERVLDCIAFRAERSAAELLQFGRYCLWLKNEIGHGRFLEGLKRRDINSTAANWAMLIYEKMGPNSAPVQNLGARKARSLVFFTKEEIDVYEQGGPLRDIPHDDVTNMSARELEAEVRKLRKKLKEDVASREKVISEKEEKINEMDRRLRGQKPPTKEQLAAVVLEPLRKKLFDHVLMAQYYLDEAVKVVVAAQKVEGAAFPQLQEWAMAHYEELAPIGNLFNELDQALNNCGPYDPNSTGM